MEYELLIDYFLNLLNINLKDNLKNEVKREIKNYNLLQLEPTFDKLLVVVK